MKYLNQEYVHPWAKDGIRYFQLTVKMNPGEPRILDIRGYDRMLPVLGNERFEHQGRKYRIWIDQSAQSLEFRALGTDQHSEGEPIASVPLARALARGKPGSGSGQTELDAKELTFDVQAEGLSARVVLSSVSAERTGEGKTRLNGVNGYLLLRNGR
jgi:hypothetical protein